jgi:hypothetical protein
MLASYNYFGGQEDSKNDKFEKNEDHIYSKSFYMST